MAEERELTVSDTQTGIDLLQLYKQMEGLVRSLSIQIQLAGKREEELKKEKEEAQGRIRGLEEKVKMLQELVTDEVTNLAPCTQRDRQLEAFMEQYKRRIHLLKKEDALLEERLFVLSLDLDQFTLINDRYGCVFGDHILRFVGRRIIKRIRKCDIASRKGQRFTVVLVDCTSRGALMKAREISQRIAAENFGESSGEQIQVTATVGIAEYDGQVSREELLRRADCAMKFGKDQGRYCSVVYREDGNHSVLERFIRNGKAKV